MSTNNKLVSISMQDIIKDSLIYVPGQLIPSIIGFVALALYTRVFSAADYGDYSLIIATSGFLGVLTYSWLNTSNLRYFSIYKNKGNLPSFYSTLFSILMGSTLFISALVYILAKFSLMPSSVSKYMLYFIWLLFTTSIYNILITILRADRKSKVVSSLNIFSSIMSLSISLLLIILFNCGISSILIGSIVTYSINSCYIFLNIGWKNFISVRKISTALASDLIKYGFPLILTLIFSWVLLISDRYMIAYFRGTYEVGIYSAAYQLANYPMTIISSIIMMAAFPVIIQTWEKEGDDVTIKIITNASRLYLLMAIPSLFGIIVLATNFISLLGEAYFIGYRILPWVCFGTLLSGLCMYTNKGFELYKNTKKLSILVAFAGSINIVLNLMLIPTKGYYGAAVSTGLSYMLYFIMSYVLSKKHLKWVPPTKSICNITFCSILMALLLNFIKSYLEDSYLNLIILISSGFLIYVFMLSCIGELDNELKSIFLKLKNLYRMFT